MVKHAAPGESLEHELIAIELCLNGDPALGNNVHALSCLVLLVENLALLVQYLLHAVDQLCFQIHIKAPEDRNLGYTLEQESPAWIVVLVSDVCEKLHLQSRVLHLDVTKTHLGNSCERCVVPTNH